MTFAGTWKVLNLNMSLKNYLLMVILLFVEYMKLYEQNRGPIWFHVNHFSVPGQRPDVYNTR